MVATIGSALVYKICFLSREVMCTRTPEGRAAFNELYTWLGHQPLAVSVPAYHLRMPQGRQYAVAEHIYFPNVLGFHCVKREAHIAGPGTFDSYRTFIGRKKQETHRTQIIVTILVSAFT